MRISDWSSDVCSSDLAPTAEETKANFAHYAHVYGAQGFLERREAMVAMTPGPLYHAAPNAWSSFFLRCGASVVIDTRFDAERLLATIEAEKEIGRASCRERGCKYV